MSSKAFASQGDLEEKKVTFAELGEGAYAYTTEGDPNSGVIVGDEGVMVVDARATPVLAGPPRRNSPLGAAKLPPTCKVPPVYVPLFTSRML